MAYGIGGGLLAQGASGFLNGLGNASNIAQQGYSRQLQMTPELIARAGLENAQLKQQSAQALAQLVQEQELQKRRIQAEGLQRLTDSLMRMQISNSELARRGEETSADNATRLQIAREGDKTQLEAARIGANARGEGGGLSMNDLLMIATSDSPKAAAAQAQIDRMLKMYPQLVPGLGQGEQGFQGNADISVTLAENAIGDIATGAAKPAEALEKAYTQLEPGWDTLTPKAQAEVESRLQMIGGQPGEIRRRKLAKMAAASQPSSAANQSSMLPYPRTVTGAVWNDPDLNGFLRTLGIPVAAGIDALAGIGYGANELGRYMFMTPEARMAGARSAASGSTKVPSTQPAVRPPMQTYQTIQKGNQTADAFGDWLLSEDDRALLESIGAFDR